MTALGLGLVAAAALMTGAWGASLYLRNAGIIDAFWGAGFAMLAVVYLAATDGFLPRGLLVVALVSVWGLRLSVHLGLRNFGQPEDYRYRAMRERRGDRFPVWSLGNVFLLQAGILWALSVPLWQAVRSPAPARLGALDLAGAIVFGVGLVFEAVGDEQLRRFRADPANRGRVLASGLWRWTRHPNYFGDALVWWGFGLVALGVPGSWWTLYAPAAMTFLLMRVSGVPLLESKLAETRPGYRDYVERTSAFVPWPPRRARGR